MVLSVGFGGVVLGSTMGSKPPWEPEVNEDVSATCSHWRIGQLAIGGAGRYLR